MIEVNALSTTSMQNARTGRLYDKYGNVREWWDNETIAKFEVKAKCIEDQYSSFYIEQAKDTVRCRLSDVKRKQP